MTQDIDIVEDIFSRVKEILGDQFQGDILVKLNNEEDKVRQSWGGTEPYIAKKRKRDELKKKALTDLNHGVPVKEVSKTHGISRTQLYLLLRRK